jgi:hypothetical protein
VNASEAGEELAEKIVAIFDALDADEREGFKADLVGLSREELLSELAEARRFLRGVFELATEILEHDVAAMGALRDAERRVEAASETVTRT